MNKVEIKNNLILIATAVVFLLFSYLLYNLFYTSEETPIYSNTFRLENEEHESINSNIEFSKLKAELFFDTLINNEINFIRVKPEIKINNPNTEIQIVISIEYKGKNVYWKSYKLQNQIKAIDTWQELEFVQDIHDFKLIKEHKLKIYFWNSSKSSFLVKNILVEMFENEPDRTNIIFNE